MWEEDNEAVEGGAVEGEAAETVEVAEELNESLISTYSTEIDLTQSIGKRYRRQDEIGTPYCVTVDFESLEDKMVTIRDSDTMDQERVLISELREVLERKFN